MSKSTIKSKKEKLNQKKFSKGSAPSPIEIIADSDDEDQNIQKRATNRTPNINPIQTLKPPNSFNFDKLKKIQLKSPKLETAETDDALQCIDTERQIGDFLNNRSLISYKLEGKQGVKFASESHHKARAFDQIQLLNKKEKREHYKQMKQLQLIMSGQQYSDDSRSKQMEQQKKEPVQQKKQHKKFLRYYQEENKSDDQENQGQKVVRCYRCLKKGHIAKNCMQEETKMKCLYCLGDHHVSQCTSSPCFRCNQLGHIAQECRSKGIQCKKCHKRGHISEDCGVIIYLDYQDKTDTDLKKLYKLSDMKKLRCLAECKAPDGHFNCHRYDLRNLQPYKVAKTILKQQTPRQQSSRSQRNQRSYQGQRQKYQFQSQNKDSSRQGYQKKNSYNKFDRYERKQRY